MQGLARGLYDKLKPYIAAYYRLPAEERNYEFLHQAVLRQLEHERQKFNRSAQQQAHRGVHRW